MSPVMEQAANSATVFPINNYLQRPRVRKSGNAAALPPVTVLKLMEALQTSLQEEHLLAVFAHHLQAVLPHHGICYQPAGSDHKLLVGERARHRLEYGLTLFEQSLGQITLMRTRPFTDDEIQRFENLLGYLVFPLRNAQMYQQAFESAQFDALTGVRNRADMEDTLRRELQLVQRQQNRLALMVVDIDRFKDINDQFGHRAGDDVLQAVSKAFKDVLRETDLVFRYGGDEFVIAMPHSDAEGACRVAERIRKAVSGLGLRKDMTHLMVTLSIGVAASREGDDLDALFARADQALYESKRVGRNRVTCDIGGED